MKATFEHSGDCGTLSITTHCHQNFEFLCSKNSDEIFRLGGTAINNVAVYEGVLLSIAPEPIFRAFLENDSTFESVGILSPEQWNDAEKHCYITEYYGVDMEEKEHGWFISKRPIIDSNYLFINLDILDGGGNLIKRYRVSTFTGECKVFNG